MIEKIFGLVRWLLIRIWATFSFVGALLLGGNPDMDD